MNSTRKWWKMWMMSPLSVVLEWLLPSAFQGANGKWGRYFNCTFSKTSFPFSGQVELIFTSPGVAGFIMVFRVTVSGKSRGLPYPRSYSQNNFKIKWQAELDPSDLILLYRLLLHTFEVLPGGDDNPSLNFGLHNSCWCPPIENGCKHFKQCN